MNFLLKEAEAFRVHCGDIRRGLCDVEGLATELHSIRLLPREPWQDILSHNALPSQKLDILLTALEKKIGVEEGALDKLIQALSKEPTTLHLAEQISTTYKSGTSVSQAQAEAPGHLTDPPTIEQLMENIISCPDWRTIGIKLGLSWTDLNQVKQSNTGLEQQKKAMFERWLRNDREASWAKLIAVLKGLQVGKVASDIEKLYK